MERTESVERELAAPSPEVLEKPVRRRFTVKYKVRLLAEADACTETGQLGELLRREGLYSSHLSTWRRQRAGRNYGRETAQCHTGRPGGPDAAQSAFPPRRTAAARIAGGAFPPPPGRPIAKAPAGPSQTRSRT